MPETPRVTPREMVRALERAGFVPDRQKGSHLTLLHADSRRRSVVSMHGRTMKVGTIHAILRQAGLTVEEFIELLK
jgi:predicted RNA binding protein YcfA (HicA-like mRNA interferase family)